MHAPSLMVHGVGFTTGGGGGGGGGASDEDTGADGAGAGGTGADEAEGATEDEGGGVAGVSACTAPCVHPATDINATATSSIRTANPLARPIPCRSRRQEGHQGCNAEDPPPITVGRRVLGMRLPDYRPPTFELTQER